MVKWVSWRWFICVQLLLATGCSGYNPSAKELVRLFVAASTRDAMKEISDQFTRSTGIPVSVHSEDSSKLAMQILQDAPADLFLSANEQWASELMDKGFGKEYRIRLGNKLVLVTQKDLASKIARPSDLTNEIVKKVALAGPNVPAGIYARQALKKLSLWDELEKQKRIISGDNVRAALTYVERGEAEAGIVYATDAMVSKQVVIACHFDAETHDPIRYPLVLLKRGNESAGAKELYQFVLSKQAAAIFQRHGFEVMADE